MPRPIESACDYCWQEFTSLRAMRDHQRSSCPNIAYEQPTDQYGNYAVKYSKAVKYSQIEDPIPTKRQITKAKNDLVDLLKELED